VDSSISQAFNCLESELNQISIALEQERQIAEQERQRAEQERQRAEQERQRAEQERQKLEKRLSKTLAELRNWKNEALRLDNKFKELAVNKVCPNCNAVRNVHRCHVCGQELWSFFEASNKEMYSWCFIVFVILTITAGVTSNLISTGSIIFVEPYLWNVKAGNCLFLISFAKLSIVVLYCFNKMFYQKHVMYFPPIREKWNLAEKTRKSIDLS